MKYALVRPAVFCLLFGSVVSTSVFAAEGFYFGGGLHSTSIGGDFDGNTFFVSSSEAIVVPKIDTGQGFALFGGLSFNEMVSVELDYLDSSHDGDFGGVPLDVNYSEFSVYLKFAFETSIPFKPVVLLGYGSSWVEVQDGAVDVNGNLGDATYSGSGFNIGFGGEYFFQPNVSVGVRVIERFAKYDEAEGEIVKGPLPEKLDGDTTTLMLTLSYHVQP